MNLRTASPAIAAAAVAIVTLFSCCKSGHGAGRIAPADSAALVREIMEFRSARDSFLLYDPASPLHTDAGVRIDAPRWYPPDIRFSFRVRLMRYTFPQRVTVYGTKGEPRTQVRYGWFELPLLDTLLRLNVYRLDPDDPTSPRNHLSVAFTDETTGKETYGVGRYLPIEDESPDRNHLYEVDFNKATNPYCAYNDRYTCAVPLREDHLPVPITAGEQRYHH
jgi:uncharacterized protein (DUF1684 family)